MKDKNLMILFNGFIRNYINLGLNNNNNNIDIIKRENKYFITIGKLLGFTVFNKNDFKEITWNEYEINSDNGFILKIFRENDLTNDLSAIHSLLSDIKVNYNKKYIQFLEVSSYKRIEFLNKIIQTSISSLNIELLIIYINKDMIKNYTYYNAYLFKNKEIINSKRGIVFSDENGSLKADFIRI